MGKQGRVMTIRSIRKGSVQWNEDDRMALISILAKAGYAVRIARSASPGDTKKQTYEYVVEYWEVDE